MQHNNRINSVSQGSEDGPRLLRDVAYERLRDAITSGDLLPGTPLSETQLSKAYEISRTPVREAIQQLAQEGLVQVIPGRSIMVAAPSMHEMMNVVHMRYLLEPEVARLAARSVSPEIRETLVQAVDEMLSAVKKSDRNNWSRLDTLFHELVMEACSNQMLGKLVFQLRNRIHYMINDPQTSLKRMEACTLEHKAVADAIIAGDEQGAEAAMRAHIEQLRNSLFERYAHL